MVGVWIQETTKPTDVTQESLLKAPPIITITKKLLPESPMSFLCEVMLATKQYSSYSIDSHLFIPIAF